MAEERVFSLTNHGFCNCPRKGRGALSPASSLSAVLQPVPLESRSRISLGWQHHVQLQLQPSSTCCCGQEGSDTFSVSLHTHEPCRLASTSIPVWVKHRHWWWLSCQHWGCCWQSPCMQLSPPACNRVPAFSRAPACSRARAVHAAPRAEQPRGVFGSSGSRSARGQQGAQA